MEMDIASQQGSKKTAADIHIQATAKREFITIYYITFI
jgi:hypothetical protein